jgi:hypothetical protein
MCAVLLPPGVNPIAVKKNNNNKDQKVLYFGQALKELPDRLGD